MDLSSVTLDDAERDGESKTRSVGLGREEGVEYAV
jgi:hypothetical protein